MKDVISGFFILLEDQIRVGDVINIADKGGLVEKVGLRTTVLRDLQGNVHYVPNGNISVVTNMTKEFSRYVFDIGVAYREDVDEVIEVIKGIDEEMRQDPEFRDDIIDPIEIMGLDQFANSAIVIRVRTTTLPIKQWRVGREFNRRIKKKFDELNIEIPFPHVTLYMGRGRTANHRLFVLSRRTDGCLTIMFVQRMERQQKIRGKNGYGQRFFSRCLEDCCHYGNSRWIHFSWLIVFGLITWSLSTFYFPHVAPDLPVASYWMKGVLAALLLFASVAFHELSHSLWPSDMQYQLKASPFLSLWCCSDERRATPSEGRILDSPCRPLVEHLSQRYFLSLSESFLFYPNARWVMAYAHRVVSLLGCPDKLPAIKPSGKTLSGVKVQDVMVKDMIVMSPNVSVEEAVNGYFLRYGYGGFPVLDGEKLRGL